jgi:antitoxin component YwqK of YwqJK toxin-antitoxin module
MKASKIIAAVFLFSINAFSQTDIPDLNQIKTKYILYNQSLDKEEPLNGQPEKHYYKNGQLAEVYYKDSLRIENYESGKTRSVTHYRNGKIEGERMFYYPNGQVEMVVNYKKGMQEGLFVLYYENGKMKYTGEFKGGRIFGERICYNEEGNLINGEFAFSGYQQSRYEGKALNGKPEGEVKVSDSSGLVMTVNFRNGKAHGLAFHYKDGKKIKAENYSEGMFVDDVPMDMK